jgi:hypothetical protein
MLKTVLKFGLYGGITILLLFNISYLFLTNSSFAVQEVIGYLSMFIALVFVFFGIRSYRDKQNNQLITFGRALGLGLLITLVPSLMFGIFDAVYVTFIYPEFYDEYFAVTVEQLSKTFSGEELATKIAEAKQMMELAKNPLFTFTLMFLTVFILGFIISLISAIILRRSAPANA